MTDDAVSVTSVSYGYDCEQSPGQLIPVGLEDTEPGPVTLATHVTRLPDGLAASLGLPPESWPLRAVTMGIGTIRGARALLILATGAAKATAVRALFHGPEDPRWPCSFLGKHPDLELIVDPAAASAL